MTDKAVLIGINSYPDAPLAGCVNDVKDMAEFLVSCCSFKPGAIRLLVDRRATTKGILTRLAWLVRDAKPGDRLLFHYSGHGAQVATRNPQDEIDGKDEVACPVDFDWDDIHLIRDKTFHDIFSKVPAGVKFVWVADACHSGSLDRGFEMPSKKTKPVKKSKAKVLGHRFMPAPADHEWRLRVADHEKKPASKIAAKVLSTPLNIAYISGCRDNQTSADAEFGGKPNGALTYFLLQSLRKDPKAPLTTVIDMTRAALAKNGYSQVPQIDGSEINQAFLG